MTNYFLAPQPTPFNKLLIAVCSELLSDEEFLERKRELLKEKKAIKAKIDSTDTRVEEWMNVARECLTFLSMLVIGLNTVVQRIEDLWERSPFVRARRELNPLPSP